MASINSDQYGGIKPAPSVGGALVAHYGSVEIAAAQSAADTVNFMTLPKGFTPLFGWLYGDDIDTGAEAYELDIGITGDSTYFGNFGVHTGDAVTDIKPEVGISMPLGGNLMTVKPTVLTANTDVIGTAVAAATAGGTGTVTLIIFGIQNDPRVV